MSQKRPFTTAKAQLKSTVISDLRNNKDEVTGSGAKVKPSGGFAKIYEPGATSMLLSNHLKGALLHALNGRQGEGAGGTLLSPGGSSGLSQLTEKQLNLVAGISKTKEEKNKQSYKGGLSRRQLKEMSLILPSTRQLTKTRQKEENPLLLDDATGVVAGGGGSESAHGGSGASSGATASKITYESYSSIAELWDTFACKMFESQTSGAQRLARLGQMSLTGARVKVVRSTNESDLKIGDGIVVQETAKTFRIVCRDDRVRCLEKKTIAFLLEWRKTGEEFLLLGSQFCRTPGQRTKNKPKNLTSTFLQKQNS